MYWYRIILIILATFTISNAKTPKSEDSLIIEALVYEEYESYNNSFLVYKELFHKYKAKVYLIKEAKSALMAKKHILFVIKELNKWQKKYKKDRVDVKRVLIPLYLSIDNSKNAISESKRLLRLSKEPIDLLLSSNAYLYVGNFKMTLKLLKQIYNKKQTEVILFRIVSLMENFTNQRKKAIRFLETHYRIYNSSKDLYIKLLILYQKDKNINGILSTYKALYYKFGKDEYLSKLINTYIYKQDFKEAIKLLEQENKKLSILYELYKNEKLFKKAINLLDKIYKQDKNPKWLSEKAILIFESSKNQDDKKMITKVIKLFQNAVKLGNDDSIYLNYYGYTLIDKNLDVKNGIKIVKQALSQQPNNAYYLDSLAWGYYKQKDCNRAYRVMKKVVAKEGLKENEIIHHWRAIKQCK